MSSRAVKCLGETHPFHTPGSWIFNASLECSTDAVIDVCLRHILVSVLGSPEDQEKPFRNRHADKKSTTAIPSFIPQAYPHILRPTTSTVGAFHGLTLMLPLSGARASRWDGPSKHSYLDTNDLDGDFHLEGRTL
jgi:hypothetical protein